MGPRRFWTQCVENLPSEGASTQHHHFASKALFVALHLRRAGDVLEIHAKGIEVGLAAAYLFPLGTAQCKLVLLVAFLSLTR